MEVWKEILLKVIIRLAVIIIISFFIFAGKKFWFFVSNHIWKKKNDAQMEYYEQVLQYSEEIYTVVGVFFIAVLFFGILWYLEYNVPMIWKNSFWNRL